MFNGALLLHIILEIRKIVSFVIDLDR